jgi:multimeric flavodoxin WrbA
MKRVTVFVGSAHKKNTHDAVVQYLEYLKALGDVESEIVTLSDYKLGVCRGCRLCTLKGEEFCPLKDDRDMLMEKIEVSDGVIFATPNYCFQVSGYLKIFLDRFSAAFHRPRYFGKTFTSIVTQGIGRGGEIVKYLHFAGSNLGFNAVKGVCVTALDPKTEKVQQKIDRALDVHSQRFYARLMKPHNPRPTLFKLMMFRISRTTMNRMLDDSNQDYLYYREMGWFESDYYYPTRMGLLKRAVGKFFDAMAPTLLKWIA